jgi:hypothetical protein
MTPPSEAVVSRDARRVNAAILAPGVELLLNIELQVRFIDAIRTS